MNNLNHKYAVKHNTSVNMDNKNIIETVLQIPLEWMLDAGKVDSTYASIVTNTLQNYSVNDVLTIDIHGITQHRGVGKVKIEKILSLQQDINSLISSAECVCDIYDTYINSQTIRVLPSAGDVQESYASLIKRFINEVASLYEARKMQNPYAIQLAYKHGYDHKLIAVNRNKDRETVRQWLTSTDPRHKSFIWELRNIICGESKLQLYAVSDEFRSALQDIQSLCQTTPLVSTLKHQLGEGVDDGVLQFVLDYVGAKKFGGDVGYKTKVKDEFVVGCDLKHLNGVWSPIFKMLNASVKPQTRESLIILIRKNFKHLPEFAENIILGIIENSPQFESETIGLMTSYKLTWSELTTMQSRIERILYDSGQAMPKCDIEVVYNRLLRENGMSDPEVFQIKNSKNIHELYEGGTWIWKEFTNEKKTISRKQLILQYIATHQKFKFDEIMAYLQTIIPTIKERSVKTILATYCISTSEGFYIDKNSREDLSELHKITSDDILRELVDIMGNGQEYTYKGLEKLYSQEYKISVPVSKIRRTCENNPEVFIIVKGGGRRIPNKVKKNPEWNGVYQEKDRKRGAQVEWKRNVKEEAINRLRYAQNYEIDSSELVAELISFIPKGIKTNNVYKVFKEDDAFIVRKKDDNRRNIIALNEAYYKQYLSSQDSASTMYIFQGDTPELQKVQQLQSRNPLYNMSTQTPEDLNNLCVSTKNFISWHLQQLEQDNMAIEDFGGAWSYMITHMNVLNGGSHNAYYRLLNQLYGYIFLPHTHNDIYYLWVEMRLSFEPYLRALLTKHGFSVGDEEGNLLQLKRLIDLCQSEGLLPKRGDGCHVTRCIAHMLRNRNFKGHNAEDTPDDVTIIRNIQEEITLYLYTSMRFQKYGA